MRMAFDFQSIAIDLFKNSQQKAISITIENENQ